MNPWNVLGWIIVSLIGMVVLIILLKIINVVFRQLRSFGQHIRTRNIPPAIKQTWVNEESTYRIKGVVTSADNKEVITIEMRRSSMDVTLDEWKNIVRNKRLRLHTPYGD